MMQLRSGCESTSIPDFHILVNSFFSEFWGFHKLELKHLVYTINSANQDQNSAVLNTCVQIARGFWFLNEEKKK